MRGGREQVQQGGEEEESKCSREERRKRANHVAMRKITHNKPNKRAQQGCNNV